MGTLRGRDWEATWSGVRVASSYDIKRQFLAKLYLVMLRKVKN